MFSRLKGSIHDESSPFSGLAQGLGLTGLPAGAQVKDLNDAINKAGRQRMLSQRAANAYMALALQAQPAQAEKILSQSMSLFDRQLVELKAFAPSPAIRDTYVKLECAWSDHKEKLIGKARTEFLAGMPTLGNAPEATPRIKQELKLGEQQWLIFDAAINSATGAAPSKEALSNVLVTSENLLTVLNDVTGMYAALA